MSSYKLRTAYLLHRSFFNYKNLFFELLEALCVGIITALTAIVFCRMIKLVHFIWDYAVQGQIGWKIPVSIALGGLPVGLITFFFARNLNGSSIPGVISSVFTRKGRIPGRVAFIRMISAALTIGSGGSAGKEGPIVQIGASLGSKFAQVLKLSEHDTVLMLACGVAAGIASAFNAPLAGIFFALEIILGRFSCHSFGIVAISSVTSCAVTRFLMGDVREFQVPVYVLTSYYELFLFVLFGLIAAAVGVGFTRSIAFFEHAFSKINIPVWIKPALGGLLCGFLAYFCPQIMGSGFEVMNEALNGNISLVILIVLVFAKALGTSLTLGSGGAGGDLAPALFTGAMLGGAYGELLQFVFPGSVCLSGAYALVGMAAVFAASSRAPITSVFMIFEITGSYHLLMPLLAASVVSALAASALDKASIYTLKLSRNVAAMHDGENSSEYLYAAKVRDVMETGWTTVGPDCSAEKAIKIFLETGYSVIPVIDADKNCIGQLDRKDITYWRMRNASENQDLSKISVKEVMRRDTGYILADDSLAEAVHVMSRVHIGVLPVLKNQDSHRVVGMISRSRIFKAMVKAGGLADDFNS